VIFAGSVIGVFVVFTGIALSVALFHPDETCAERAMEILKELLRLFRKGPGDRNEPASRRSWGRSAIWRRSSAIRDPLNVLVAL
jgi:hypothetical protein